MTKTISAVDARHGLGQLMNEVSLRGDHYIIERAGKPVVAVVPVEEFQAWMRLTGTVARDGEDLKRRYPLWGTKVKYSQPFKGVAEGDWEALE